MADNVIYRRFGPQAFTAPEPPVFYNCGCCGQYHPINWDGDCRDDDNRFFADELDEKYGSNGEWSEVLNPAVGFDDYIDMIESEQGIKINDDNREHYRPDFEDRVPAEIASPTDPDYNPNQLVMAL
jgi:hypothetical protein